MSITGIGGYQIASAEYANQARATPALESDGDVDRSRVTAPTNTGVKNGLFASAISETLFQIGVTPASANVATGAAPTNPQQVALNAFAQNLFGALQPQNNGKTPSTVGGKTSTSAKKEIGGSTLASRLQNLIQQASSENSSTTETDADSKALSALQQSYEGLLSSQGASGSQPPLPDFLHALAKNLQDAPPTGNVISTSA